MERPYSAGRPQPLPVSLWAATTEPRRAAAPLQGTVAADVTVIGAGFMGLAAAARSAEHGARVVVLEAAEVGWGASGRNHGLLAPGLKRDPDEVRELLGNERAERLLRFARGAADALVELVQRHDIDCDLRRNGWIQPAHTRRALPVLERRVRDWAALGADLRLIDADELELRLGTDYYAGALFDPGGGCLNPLALVRGLARVAERAKATLYESTPALRIVRSGGGWIVATPEGDVRSDYVVCCTNAYNDGIAAMRGVLIPVRTAQVATAPLSAAAAARILPGGEATSDTQRLLTSFRLTADQRLIMGGASATAGNEKASLFAWLHKGAAKRFPFLGQIDWRYGWSGYLALTDDHLPKIFDAGDGFWAGTGCNGRGIALSTAIGQLIADRICAPNADDCPVPVTRPRRQARYRLRHPGVAVSVVVNRVLDLAERRIDGGSSAP